MSRVKPSQFFTPDQGEFFPSPTLEGLTRPWDAGNAPALDLGTELLGALCAALREARDRGLSRERVVDRMNVCLAPDQHVTLRQLNTWTAPSAEGKRFPAEYLPAFCWAVGSVAPFATLLAPIHHEPIDRRDQLAAELGRAEVEAARLRRTAGELRKRLGG